MPLLVSMDFLFDIMEPESRGDVLRSIMQSFGFTYICLWIYSDQPINCLQGFDGVYQEEASSQASSSSGSSARQLFDMYRRLRDIHIDQFERPRVPGLVFRTSSNPYMALRLPELQNLAYSEVQLRFYQEARIQTVVFIGCRSGEIELGMATDPPIDLRAQLENVFSSSIWQELPQPIDQSQQPPSSSSSSLRSLSVDSPEYPPFMPNLPRTFFIQQQPQIGEPLLEEALRAATSTLPPPPPAAPVVSSPHQQAIQSLSQMRNVHNPNIEVEDATLVRAILAVLSSSPSQQITSQALPPIGPAARGDRPTAFGRFHGPLAPATAAAATRRRSMFKRAVSYYREVMRRQQLQAQAAAAAAAAAAGNPRPMTPQSWQHTIQERRRRKKINDSFLVLRSLLPSGSKKDKASVLSKTTEYLSALQSQLGELIKRNQMLELQLSSIQKPEKQQATVESSSSSSEGVSVQVTPVSSSTSEARFLDLRVAVRGKCSLLDLAFQLLQFLKQQRNLNLMSVESSTTMSEQNTPIHGIMLRLKIEGDEFDEAAFQEAVRRAVDESQH